MKQRDKDLKWRTKMLHKNVKLFTVTLFCLGLTGLQAQTVKDIDGNVYKTVTIGTQVWMAENLKTTKYNDDTAIRLVTDNAAWEAIDNSHESAYCWYENDATANKNTYGALYNWYTLNTGKLCPTGWHIPSDVEWTTLITYLGSESMAGNKLKETGKTHWRDQNTGATNESGFTALPSGYRSPNGSFHGIGFFSSLWSSGEYNMSSAWYRLLNYSFSSLLRVYAIKQSGFSVRCIKDN
jgi:uncharacterized protein (TIGR02145 family)